MQKDVKNYYDIVKDKGGSTFDVIRSDFLLILATKLISESSLVSLNLVGGRECTSESLKFKINRYVDFEPRLENTLKKLGVEDLSSPKNNIWKKLSPFHSEEREDNKRADSVIEDLKASYGEDAVGEEVSRMILEAIFGREIDWEKNSFTRLSDLATPQEAQEEKPSLADRAPKEGLRTIEVRRTVIDPSADKDIFRK